MLDHNSGAARLARARKQAGLSLARVGRMLGVSRSYVCRLERGQRKPGLALALKLQSGFGIPPEEWK